MAKQSPKLPLMVECPDCKSKVELITENETGIQRAFCSCIGFSRAVIEIRPLSLTPPEMKDKKE